MSGPGRPSKYSQELADKICEITATSNRGINSIAKELGISATVVFNWLLDDDKKDFVEKYTRAKQLQAEFLAEEILDIADDSRKDTIEHEEFGAMPDHEWMNRSRLRVDTRKWLMSKLMPKKYGDKLDLTTQGEKITPVITGMIIEPPKEKEGE